MASSSASAGRSATSRPTGYPGCCSPRTGTSSPSTSRPAAGTSSYRSEPPPRSSRRRSPRQSTSRWRCSPFRRARRSCASTAASPGSTPTFGTCGNTGAIPDTTSPSPRRTGSPCWAGVRTRPPSASPSAIAIGASPGACSTSTASSPPRIPTRSAPRRPKRPHRNAPASAAPTSGAPCCSTARSWARGAGPKSSAS